MEGIKKKKTSQPTQNCCRQADAGWGCTKEETLAFMDNMFDV